MIGHSIIEINEIKTGSVKWTQKRAQEHPQLLQYATMVWLKYKRLPTKVRLIWIPTIRESDGEVRFTGETPQIFEVTITLTKILEYMSRVSKVAVEIDKLYKKELGLK